MLTDDAEDSECSICMIKLVDSEHVQLLVCKHVFHARCIDPWVVSLLPLHQIVTNKIIKQNGIQRRHEFQNICLYETGKVAVSKRILSSIIRWHQILHE
jgi:hypothetical protein